MKITPNNAQLSERALSRRIKRQLKNESLDFFAVCPPAFVRLLDDELRELGIVQREVLEGGVAFTSELDAIYHTNLRLRSAHRVLLRLKQNFLAQSYPMLFDHVKRIPWEIYFGFNTTLKVSVSAKESKLNFQQAFTETVHRAILERVMPLRLSPQLEDKAEIEILARVYQDRCTLSLNTSGNHLHKRGYRQHVGEAPLRETLAASVLLWLGKYVSLESFDTILDPFCGSGTLLIEAAGILQSYPVGSQRPFAFEVMPFFQPSKWQRFIQEALTEMQPLGVRLQGSDKDAHVLQAARHNSGDLAIEYTQEDALEASYSDDNTLIISNLPYGKRLGSVADVAELLMLWYARIPVHYHLCLILPERLEVPSSIAQAVAHRIAFRNGNLRVNALYIPPRH